MGADAPAMGLSGKDNYRVRVRRVLGILGLLLGTYLIVRAIVEVFVIDYGDPATYRDDWGGPSLAGVLAVHCGPGLIALVLIILALRQRARASKGVRRVRD